MEWTLRYDQPVYAQISRQLTAAIVTGIYAPGQRLPTVRDIALDAGVNPNTVQRALSDMERDGLVYSQRTSGRFVTDDKEKIRQVRETMAKEVIDEFLEAMQKLGINRREVIAFLEKEETK